MVLLCLELADHDVGTPIMSHRSWPRHTPAAFKVSVSIPAYSSTEICKSPFLSAAMNASCDKHEACIMRQGEQSTFSSSHWTLVERIQHARESHEKTSASCSHLLLGRRLISDVQLAELTASFCTKNDDGEEQYGARTSSESEHAQGFGLPVTREWDHANPLHKRGCETAGQEGE